jgi:hypothetical protein
MATPFSRQKGQRAASVDAACASAAKTSTASEHHARKNRDDDTVTVLLQLKHNSYAAQASVMLKLRAG